MSKSNSMAAHSPVLPPKSRFSQYQQKTPQKQKLNSSRSAPPHTKTRASPRYPANDRRHPQPTHSATAARESQRTAPQGGGRGGLMQVKEFGQQFVDSCKIRISKEVSNSQLDSVIETMDRTWSIFPDQLSKPTTDPYIYTNTNI